jgi:hypothetical protein
MADRQTAEDTLRGDVKMCVGCWLILIVYQGGRSGWNRTSSRCGFYAERIGKVQQGSGSELLFSDVASGRSHYLLRSIAGAACL